MSPRVLDCTEVRSSLPLYSGGDLHPSRQAALDRHLATCVDCRLEAARANSAREALVRGLERGHAGRVDLWPALRNSLAAEGLISTNGARQPMASPRTLPQVHPGRRWLSIAAAAAAALFIGLWMQRSNTSQIQVQPTLANVSPDTRLIDQAQPSPELVVTPVKESQGLHRVPLGEPRWSENADVFGSQPSPMSQFSPWSPNVGSPVTLQRVRPNIR